MALRSRLTALAALVPAVLIVLVSCAAKDKAASEPPPTTTPPVTTISSSTSTPPPTGGETSPPNQDNRCTFGILSGTIEPQDADAGNRYATLVVTNKSQLVCTLWGYGGLDLLGETKNPIPTVAERNLDPASTLVTLGPGDSASKTLHWTVVASGDEPTDGPCQPPAAAIRVTPPDETEGFDVDFDFGSVCDHGRIATSAYFPK